MGVRLSLGASGYDGFYAFFIQLRIIFWVVIVCPLQTIIKTTSRRRWGAGGERESEREKQWIWNEIP